MEATLPQVIEERTWRVLMHVPFEGPGLISEVAGERGLAIDLCRLYDGELLPALDELRGLVVMGGPMGVTDIEAHPYLAGERELIADAIERQIPVLGVCLGAQLMAAGMRAEVYAGAREEIGAGTVTLTAEGRSDPVLGGDEPVLPVVHWHGETFDLPEGAVLLASSEAYPHQAFRIGRSAYGLQFHVEVNQALHSDWHEHLPSGVHISRSALAQIELAGHRILNSFFELATSL